MAEDGQGSLPSGYDIGGVRIEAALDRGPGWARYRARRLSDESLVLVIEYALAAPAAGSRESTEARSRAFRRRAEALLALRHPNLLAVDRVLAPEGVLYLILDLPPGRSLAVRFRAGEALDETALLALLDPLLDAVAAAHAAGVVHGGIGPDAIYVGDDFTAPVIDFTTGLPAPAVAATPDPDYAAYEMHAAEGVPTPATDLYGLAAVLYRIVAGEPPMDALARRREFAERKLDPLMPAAVAGHGRFGAPLLKAIDKALALKPRDRPQAIAEWRALFVAPAPTAASAEADERVLTPIEPGSRVAGAGTARAQRLRGTAPTRASRRRKRGAGKMVAAAVVVALALAAGGYGYIRYDQARRQDVAAAQAAAEKKAAAAQQQAAEKKAREAAATAAAKEKKVREAAAAAVAKQKAAVRQAARRKATRESAKRKAAAAAARRAKAKAASRQQAARQARTAARTAAMEAARAGTKAAAGGDDKAALARYGRAIESGALSKALLATTLYNRGTVYARMGRTDAAIADFTRALAIRPKDADLYYNRCATYLRVKRRAAAIADCRMALKLQPGHTRARRALVRLGAAP